MEPRAARWLLAGSELPEVVPAAGTQAVAELSRTAASGGGTEIVFLQSPSLHDGRFANDGWLQELPDPLTKFVWDNPALVSPKTAESLHLADEDVVRIDYASRSLELPVAIVPGMADGVVAVTVGYGRSHAGRIGSGVGFNTFAIRTSTAPASTAAQPEQAVARVRAVDDAGPRQHGRTADRPRVDARRASIRAGGQDAGIRGGAWAPSPHRAPNAEKAAHSASSRRTPSTSRSGRNTPTIRARSGA
jgi:hypothetical protein